MADTTEVEAAAALAAQPESFPVTPGDIETILMPPMWGVELKDHEQFAPHPRRSRGGVITRDVGSFLTAVRQREDGPRSLYADETRSQLETRTVLPLLTCILNDDHGATPGWRDHQVCLAIQRTPEWEMWRANDGKLLPQHEFARHIEDGLREVREPSPADMLDMAQSFQAITNAKFRGGQRLATGERQFMYDEEVAAKAGAQGQITIPDEFVLEVVPFYGAHPVTIRASFRFQLRQAELSLGYRLDRPHELERAAFRGMVGEVEGELEMSAIYGVAPMPVNQQII